MDDISITIGSNSIMIKKFKNLIEKKMDQSNWPRSRPKHSKHINNYSIPEPSRVQCNPIMFGLRKYAN